MKWVGTATEQGAGYAADGYARLKGLGAIVTTFGAGELSAMNAIAGAYAESVPVVHVVGTPSLAARKSDSLLHHNLPGCASRHFTRMAAEITTSQTDLRVGTARDQIDRAVRTAVRTSLPVYIAVPADVAAMPVPAPEATLHFNRYEDDNDLSTLFDFAVDACHLLASATSTVVLLGHLAARHGVTSEVEEVVEAGDVPLAVLSTAKGDFSESDRHFVGLYAGAASEKRARRAVEDCDVLINVGATLVDSVSNGGTHDIRQSNRIDLCPSHAKIGARVYAGIGLRHSLAAVAAVLREFRRPSWSAACSRPATDRRTKARDRLTQHDLWGSIQRLLQPGDLVIADQGTALHGAVELSLPPGARLLAQPLWASSGWAVPAALGASLAAPDRRVVVLVGDGALQQTATELGKLLTLGSRPSLSSSTTTVTRSKERSIDRPPFTTTSRPGMGDPTGTMRTMAKPRRLQMQRPRPSLLHSDNVEHANLPTKFEMPDWQRRNFACHLGNNNRYLCQMWRAFLGAPVSSSYQQIRHADPSPAKEAAMHPTITYQLAQERIADLHRQARSETSTLAPMGPGARKTARRHARMTGPRRPELQCATCPNLPRFQLRAKGAHTLRRLARSLPAEAANRSSS